MFGHMANRQQPIFLFSVYLLATLFMRTGHGSYLHHPLPRWIAWHGSHRGIFKKGVNMEVALAINVMIWTATACSVVAMLLDGAK